jgi:hypothetical protein
MKSNLLLRPMWHQLPGRVQAQVFVGMLAYALGESPRPPAASRRVDDPHSEARPTSSEEFAERSPDESGRSSAASARCAHQRRPLDHAGWPIAFAGGPPTVASPRYDSGRVARPNAEQADLPTALKLTLPERLCTERDVTDSSLPGLAIEKTPPER